MTRRRGMFRRVFLNRPRHHSVAMIHAYVGKDKDGVELKISDCDRTVSLDFDGYDEDGRANSLHKIDTLVSVLTQFSEALHKKYEPKAKEPRG